MKKQRENKITFDLSSMRNNAAKFETNSKKESNKNNKFDSQSYSTRYDM
jgi:hypothetical protein